MLFGYGWWEEAERGRESGIGRGEARRGEEREKRLWWWWEGRGGSSQACAGTK
jgi:hypothetical protein